MSMFVYKGERGVKNALNSVYVVCTRSPSGPLLLILEQNVFHKKSLFQTIYLIFQTRTMRIQWAIFGMKVSNMDLSGIANARTFLCVFGRG